MLLEAVDALTYRVFGFSEDSRIGGAVHFFIYDTIKILVLLFAMIWVIGVLRTFLPQERIRQWMNRRGIWGNFYAALFGAITPFCSCSSIPIFLGFLEAGIPLGVTFSFLITSPLINEYLVILMLGYFGWKITVLYVVSGLLIGIVTGIILGRLKLEAYLDRDLIRESSIQSASESFPTFWTRIQFGFREAISITGKIWGWVLVGVAVGAGIHNFIPESMIQSVMSRAGFWSVPVAVLLGVPMYGSCAAIVPIAVVLFQKGIPLGTALAFMMAIAALSLPEAIMLRRAMRLPLILIFFAITSLAIVVIGYLFNFLQVILI